MRRFLTLHIILFFSVLSWAQATGVPYTCSFEDSEDLSGWVLNPNTSSAADKWMVGSMVHSEGRKSLYISSDGINPVYGSQPNIVAAYLRFKFPDADEQKNYDISFDWKGMGDSTNSKLYVIVCPEMALTTSTYPQYLDNIVSTTSGELPKAVAQVCEQLGESKERFVCGSDQWQNVALSNEVRVSGLNSKRFVFAILFIWVNANIDGNIHQSGICIDNIQIGSATLKKPKKVQAEPVCADSTMIVSWESSGAVNEFEIQYRKIGSSTWRRQDGIRDGVDGYTRDGVNCSYVLQRIMEGTYDVRVCGKAGSLVSNFSYKNNILVYCPENHCVAYLDLYSPNVVCTYGYHPLKSSSGGVTPYDNIGVIDNGPDSEESRHTIHMDPTETDPRTDDQLFTVPKGALASVRLGNWNDGAEAESITYNFTVDAQNQGVLIAKYAVVLENPGGHPHDEEPSFDLVVLDENDNVIDESCGQAVFSYSDGVEAGWNLTKDNKAAWKDWTTIGVNLMPYAGQNIKVRFTTYDCAQTGHYGYAYLTVDCASARIETENCGNDAKIECFAPEGFAYAWYKGNPDAPGNKPFWFDRELSAEPTRQEYTCRVSFIEDPSCYFDVSTISAPRFPVPSYTVEPVYEECSSKLRFHNTSHVMYKYEDEENHTSEPTEDGHWSFRRLSDGSITESYNWSPVYTCRSEGDTLEVIYTTYIGVENACDSTRIDTIITPNIIPGETEFFYETCPESPIYFGKKWFQTDTTYVGVYPNFAGCDSVSTLHLKVWPEVKDTYRHDSICSDSSVVIAGDAYNYPMTNQLFMLKSVHGCDSAVYMTLTVNQRLDASVDSLSYLCADDENLFIPFTITAGVFDSLVITFNTPQLRDTVIYDSSVSTVAIPYPNNITPGYYTAELAFHQFCCGVYRETRDVEIRYSSAVVAQKWNDVLTLLSPEANGGYKFTRFQWYKNGVPLAGEIGSYLYQPLDTLSEYYVVLTRPDSVSIATCPIYPVYHEQQTPYPTIVNAGQKLPIYMEQSAIISYYTVSGQHYSSYTLPQGYTTLIVPDDRGVFVLKSVNTKGETKAQIMIVN